MMEYDTENMNSEEIYSSLRGVTEAIQSFSYRSQEDLNEPIRPESKRDDAVSHFSQGFLPHRYLLRLYQQRALFHPFLTVFQARQSFSLERSATSQLQRSILPFGYKHRGQHSSAASPPSFLFILDI